MAYNNIYAFHAAQKPVEKIVENMKVSKAYFCIYSSIYICTEILKVIHTFSLYLFPNFGCQGVRCKRVARSISSVGLYVPGGTAVLPSTALMLSVVW